MNKIIFQGLEVIFAGNVVNDVTDFISKLMTTLKTVFATASSDKYFTIFSTVAVSLMIIFFFADLLSMASKDMITLERLVLSFIKLIIAITLLIYLPNIITVLFGLIDGIYDMSSNFTQKATSVGVTFWGSANFPKYNESIHKCYQASGTGFTAVLSDFMENLGLVLTSFVLQLISLGAKLVAYLTVLSNAIWLVVRAIFAPLAIANCFEDGQRSTAIVYLKKFVAEGLNFALILGVLYAASLLSAGLITNVVNGIGVTDLNAETIPKITNNFGAMIMMLAIQVSSIGALMKTKEIASDLVGAR